MPWIGLLVCCMPCSLPLHPRFSQRSWNCLAVAQCEPKETSRTPVQNFIQIADLEASINAVPCDTVVIATPMDLRRVIKIERPATVVRAGCSRSSSWSADGASPNRKPARWPLLTHPELLAVPLTQVTYAVEDRDPPFLREEVDKFVARCFPS